MSPNGGYGYEMSTAPRPKLTIGSEDEFNALMEQIDAALIKDEVPISARRLRAGLEITKRYDIVLNAVPGKKPILPGVFTPEQISLRIHDWMERRYGDRLKIPFRVGRTLVPLRGSTYVINCPVVIGSVQFVCDPQSFGQKRNPIGRQAPPVCNVIDSIEGFTADLARSLTAEEVIKIGILHASAMGAYMALHAILKVQFVNEAIGDLDAAVDHLAAHKPQLGLSKWASLQAAEKLFKAYIAVKGGKVRHHHNLGEHASDAAQLGMPPPPKRYIDDLQCRAGVRYGETAVTLPQALLAHHISLEICEVAARSIGHSEGIPMPLCPRPTIDGMPADEFLAKHASTGDDGASTAAGGFGL